MRRSSQGPCIKPWQDPDCHRATCNTQLDWFCDWFYWELEPGFSGDVMLHAGSLGQHNEDVLVLPVSVGPNKTCDL